MHSSYPCRGASHSARSGAMFVTLRVLLELAPWIRQSAVGIGGGANPAPQASRPAQ